MIIPYDASKEERDKVAAERERKLYQSFENMRKQIDEQIKTMNFSTVSERVKRQQLEEIRNKLQEQLQSHYNALESGLKDDMVSVGQSVLKESESFYTSLNMPIGMSITSFPIEIMNNVVNGSVYDDKWYLSRALWGDYTEKLDQINEVISNGIGLNLSSFEIAKQLEQYVDPAAMHPSKTIVTPCLQDPVSGKLYSKDYVNRHPEKDWSGFKEKNSYFRYGKVDYNAQRLARTLINHAYQQNVVHQAKTNPFATGVKWEASGGERMCEICEERDGKIFPVDDVPLDHPNGMCTFSVVTDLNMMEISDVLADWVNGVPTDYDEKLDDWYNDRAEVPIERAPDMFAQHVIAEGKDITGEWERRFDQYDFEIEDAMAAQGFDGLPRVVSKEEFEAAVKAANNGNGFIAKRNYTAIDQETLDMYRDMLYNGKWYVDCSTGGAQYGQGMYCAADYSGNLTQGIQNEMQHYKNQNIEKLRESFIGMSEDKQRELLPYLVDQFDPNLTGEQKQALVDFTIYDRFDSSMSIISRDRAKEARSYLISSDISIGKFSSFVDNYRTKPVSYTETLTLDPSAKVITYNDLMKLKSKYDEKFAPIYQEHQKQIDAQIIEYLSSGNVDQGHLHSLIEKKKDEMSMNAGTLAVLLGYDAINAEGHGESDSYTVVLNRTKLIIQEP